MDQHTMQLAVVTPNDEIDEAAEEIKPRRGWLGRNRTPGRHSIQGYVAQLKRDLFRTQELNKVLSANLSTQVLETEVANAEIRRLEGRVAELEEKLRVAEEANSVNAHAVDFRFAERPIDDHLDQATMPVPQIELLADSPSLMAVASNAAVALLDRVVPKVVERGEPQLVPAFAPPVTRVMPLVVEPDDEGDEDEPEVYNETGNGWNVSRPRVPTPLVSWGTNPSSRTLQADMSTTGTYRVTPLQQRGTGPTAIPGVLS